MKAVTEFKIRPTKRARLFYTVKIFNTLDDMHKYAASGRPKAFCIMPGPNAAGLCTTWYNKKDTYECGEVLLTKPYLGVRIVAHEITHAMFGLKRRKLVGDLNITDENHQVIFGDEEWCVDAVGLMTAQVYLHLNKYGTKLGLY